VPLPQLWANYVDKPMAPYVVGGGMIATGLAHITAALQFPSAASPFLLTVGAALIYVGANIVVDQFPNSGIDLIPGFNAFKHYTLKKKI
jgi:hypothetical protein